MVLAVDIPHIQVRFVLIQDFLVEDAANFKKEIENTEWEQNFYGAEIRKPIRHLEQNFCFLNRKIEAHVTNFGENHSGKKCAHFFKQFQLQHLNKLQILVE